MTIQQPIDAIGRTLKEGDRIVFDGKQYTFLKAIDASEISDQLKEIMGDIAVIGLAETEVHTIRLPTELNVLKVTEKTNVF